FGDCDARQICAGGNVLANFDRHYLQDALDASTDMKGIEFTVLQGIESFLLIDMGLLRHQSGFGGVSGVGGAIFLKFQANTELLESDFRKLSRNICTKSFRAKFFVNFILNFSLLVVATYRRRRRFLIEQFAVESNSEILIVGLCGFQ